MSQLPSGKYVCDKDGADVGNGGIDVASILSDLDPDNPGNIRILHFCRDRVDENGKKIKGCTTRILSKTNLADYNERGAQ